MMRVYYLAALAFLFVSASGARADCALGGNPASGYDVIWYDPGSNTWRWDGPYGCDDCIEGVTNVQNTGYQAACASRADDQAGGTWYCDATEGYFAGLGEANSSTNRAAFLLTLGVDPRYQPPSNWECYGSAGQYLSDPPYIY